jgi:hypothetical protein
MANANTVSGVTQSGTGRNQFPVQTIAATAETILKIGTDSGTNVNYFLTVPGAIAAATSTTSLSGALGAATGLDVNANQAITEISAREYGLPSGEVTDQFSSSSWDGRPFKVRICGIGTAGHNAAQTLVFNLYQGISATLGSDNLVGTTLVAATPFPIAQSSSNVSYNFLIEFTGLWDATSKILSGSYLSNIGSASTYGSQFVTSTVTPTVVSSLASSGLSFLATITMGNAASSTVQVREFVLDKV